MTFNSIMELVLMVISIIFGMCALGSEDKGVGRRCVALAYLFMIAFFVVFIFGVAYGR